MMRGAEDIVRETISQTRDAVDQAKDIVRDVAHKLKERYPHGVKDFSACGAPAEDTVIPAEGLTGLDIHLVNGDVDIRVIPDPDAQVILSGNTQQLNVRLREDGILAISPDDRTASAAFFSTRGLLSTDVELLLPARRWDSISITTASGDVEVHDSIDAAQLAITTASGDVDLYLSALPQTLDASTKSGDCEIRIPDGLGFSLRYRTISGNLRTDFELVGSLASRCREAMYLDGGSCAMNIETVSGSLVLRRL